MSAVPTGSPLLQFFWDLAETDVAKRTAAAASLLTYLHTQAEEQSVQQSMFPDLEYTVKRLIRGLASPRANARQGFAVALSEVLREFPSVSLQHVRNSMKKEFVVTGSMKGHEERDALLGSVFAVGAIARSGRLYGATHVEGALLKELVTHLYDIASRKAVLRAACYSVIGELVIPGLEDPSFKTHLFPYLKETVIGRSVHDWTVDSLTLALTIQSQNPPFPLAEEFVGLASKDNLFSPSNMAVYVPCLRESHIHVHPSMHPVWPLLLSHASRDLELLKALWDIVDTHFITTTLERKDLALVLFCQLIDNANPDQASVLLSHNLLHTLATNSSNKNNHLHEKAVEAMRHIEAAAAKSVDLRIAVLGQLLSHKKASVLFQSKLFRHFLQDAKQEGLHQYVAYLLGMLKVAVEEKKDAQQINWAVEQLHYILRRDHSDKKDVVDATEDKSKKVSKPMNKKGAQDDDNGEEKQKVGLTAEHREAISSTLRALTNIGFDSSNGLQSITRDVIRKRIMLILLDHTDEELFASQVVDVLHAHQQSSRNSDGDDEDTTANRAVLYSLLKVCLKDQENVQQRSFAQLVSYLYIDSFSDSAALSEYVADLKNVHERLFKPKEAEKGRKAKTNKKAQKEEDKPADAQAEEPNPMDVFVDILVALLHRRNATLREVVKSVFTAFATDVTVNGLQILIDVVTQPIEESKAEEDEEDGEIDFGSDAGSDTMEESKGGEDGDEDAEDDENADDGEDGDSDVSMNDDGSDADSIDDEQESEEDLMDDEEMLANDDKLAAVMREYKARASASSNFLHDQMTIKFKALDLLDIMVRRNASLPQRSSILVATLVPLLQALRRLAAPSASTQKTDLVDPLFARMKSLLVHRICHNKHLLENAQDATVVETVMKGVFDFVKHCSFRSVSSIAWTCLCFVMKLSKAIDEEHKQAVRIASYALKDMMLRKSTHLLPAQFKDLMSRFPTTIGKSLTVALLTYISEDKAKKFKRQQAITLVEGVFHSELKNRTLDTETLRAIAERLPGLFSRYTEEIKSAPAKKAKLVSKGIAITVQFVHNVLKEADGVDLKSSVAAARALSQASEKIPQLVTSVEQLSSTYKLNEDTNDEDAVMVDAQKEKKKKKQAKK